MGKVVQFAVDCSFFELGRLMGRQGVGGLDVAMIGKRVNSGARVRAAGWILGFSIAFGKKALEG